MKLLNIVVIPFLFASSVIAQPREGRRVELSLSGSYQNYSTGSSSESHGAFLLSPRLGIFVVQGLEIEPEFLTMVVSGSEPTYMLNANVSYNVLTAGKGVPFLLIGYGIANTVPFFNVPFGRYDFSVGVFNIGAGVKAYLTPDIALRIEYRYQGFSGEHANNYGIFSYTEKVDTRIHSVQFGFSVLL